MFSWVKRMRDERELVGRVEGFRKLLFGDVPLGAWPTGSQPAGGEPWLSFVRARELAESGKVAEAVEVYREIAGRAGVESRHVMQAWFYLRRLGVKPGPEVEKLLLAVCLDVSTPEGLDTLIVYADRRVRFIGQGRKVVGWERPHVTLDEAIDGWFAVGREVVVQIGPWEDEFPHGVPDGRVRIAMFTPSGPHFGLGDRASLEKDALGGAFLRAGERVQEVLLAAAEDAS